MPGSGWDSRLRDAEHASAPLILSCAFGILLLSIPRDYIVNGFMPPVLLVVNLVTASIFIAFLLWAYRGKPGVSHTKYVLMLAAGLLSVKAVAMVAVELKPYPFVLTVLVFSLSLFYLSRTYYLTTTLVVIGLWSIVAYSILPGLQFFATLLALLVATVLGFVILDRRIAAQIRVFMLEERVEKLETMLPMCAECKKTRDEEGEWKSIEKYLHEQEGKQVSHAICPECSERLYGEVSRFRKKPQRGHEA